MTKALVLWSDPKSTNLGVRTLAEGTTSLLRSIDPNCEVFYQGYGPGDAPERIGSPRNHLRRLARRGSPLQDWLSEFDLVVDTRAGDSFADIYGLQRHWTMTLMAEVVHRADVPLVLGPQTIGPFSSRVGRQLAKRSMSTAAAVMARDPESAQQAAALGRPVDVLTTDVVFAIDRGDVGDERRDIVLNPSGLLWKDNNHVDSADYRRVVRELCARLISDGRRISLLSHVLDSPLADNDVPVAYELADEFEIDDVLIPSSVTEVRRMLASAQIVIGSRMHACLNALSVGTPAVPLAYSRKFDPLLSSLGWPHTIDLRRPDPGMVDSVLATMDAPDLRRDALALRERADALLIPAWNSLTATLRPAGSR